MSVCVSQEGGKQQDVQEQPPRQKKMMVEPSLAIGSALPLEGFQYFASSDQIDPCLQLDTYTLQC